MICETRRNEITKNFIAAVRETLTDNPDIKPEEVAAIALGAMLGIITIEVGPDSARAQLTYAMDEIEKYNARKMN